MEVHGNDLSAQDSKLISMVSLLEGKLSFLFRNILPVFIVILGLKSAPKSSVCSCSKVNGSNP